MEQESGRVNHAEQQRRYVALQARKRGKLLERMDDLQRSITKVERRIDVGGNPHLFEKMTGYLATQHEVTKGFISTIRDVVRKS